MAKRNPRKIATPNLEPLESLPGFLIAGRIITAKRADQILGTIRELAQCLLQMSDRIEYLDQCIDGAAKHAGKNEAEISRLNERLREWEESEARRNGSYTDPRCQYAGGHGDQCVLDNGHAGSHHFAR